MLDGKAVIITGSGRGIGAGCAKGAARRGASVVVNDVSAEAAEQIVAEIEAAGGTAISCVADVSEWDEAGRLIETCLAAFGRVDGLVNNAALFHRARIDDYDPVIARAMVDVNVLGPMHCAAHAVKPMLRQGKGSIVNVISGAHMGIPTMGVYGATKGAVASMVYTWAIELDGTGVRVNALSPFGSTALLANSRAYMNEKFGADVGDVEDPMEGAAIQPPEDNSPVVEYLLSDAAGDVNGQLVRMDKGELQVYTHPALLLPAVVRESWTAEDVAAAFANELRDRQIPCGVRGMESLPVELTSGFWQRKQPTGT